MLQLHKVVYLLTIMLIFFTSESDSQIIEITVPTHSQAQKIKQTSTLSGEDLFKNFFGNRENVRLWYFTSNHGKDTLKFHIDDLWQKFKIDIDSLFNMNYQWEETENVQLNSLIEKKIHSAIQILSQQGLNKSNQEEYNRILALINQLPISKEKIWLLIKLTELNIKIDSYNQDVISVYSNTKIQANKIEDLYERGKAFTYIGDFAQYYFLNDSAIRIYYLAKECFYNCKKNKKIKYLEEGILFDKTADVFDRQFLEEGAKKRNNYYLSATEYFTASNSKINISESYSHFLCEYSYMLMNYESYTSDSIWSHTERMYILKDLETWFYDYKLHYAPSVEINYLCFYSLAQIYRAEHKKNASLNYYLEALLWAINGKKIRRIVITLENIAHVYALLGNEKLAIKYADLAIYYSNKSGNQYESKFALLRKSRNYFTLLKNDSALFYVNKVQFDTTIFTTLYPPVQSYLLEYVDDIKYRILNDLYGPTDSTWRYYNSTKDYHTESLKDHIQLLQTESDAIKEWLERIKNGEIGKEKRATKLEKKLREIAQENEQFSKAKSIQDSIAKLQSDSISLLNQRIALTARDSTQEALIKGQKEKRDRIIVEKLNFWLQILIALLLVLFGIGSFLYIKNKKTSKKLLAASNQLLIASTSDLRLRSAIKNHNLGNHYSKIKVMLIDNKISEAQEYCNANSKYFDTFYEALLKDGTSLKEEVGVLEAFIETEKIYNSTKIDITYVFNGIDPNRTAFLCDILVPLYENVLMNGVTTKKDDYSFNIEIVKVGDKLHGSIYDNGDGNDNIGLAIRENSYLDMLRTRLINYFRLKNISIDDAEVFKITSKTGAGTKITILMPYETI